MKQSPRPRIRRWLAGALLAAAAGPAAAAPIISVDMDVTTPGIQSSLVAPLGSTFTVGILIGDDGMAPTPTVFDTVILDTFFNDAGPVLGLGPTGTIAGALAGSPTDLDLFGGLGPTMPGMPLGVGPALPLPPGFASGSGPVGLLEFFPAAFTIGPGSATSIYTIDFVALAKGRSTILAAGAPPGSPELAFFGGAVPAALAPGSVDVVPEPNPLTLLAIGLAALLAGSHRRRARARA